MDLRLKSVFCQIFGYILNCPVIINTNTLIINFAKPEGFSLSLHVYQQIMVWLKVWPLQYKPDHAKL